MDFMWNIPRGFATCYCLTSVKIKKDGRVEFLNKLALGRDAFLRVDRPHPDTPFNYHHININQDYSGIPDPHTKISRTEFDVSVFACMYL